MALDKTRWGNAVAAAVKAVGVQAGTDVTDAQLQAIWQAMADESKKEINTNAGIELQAGDVQVPGAGLSNGGGPVTGTANIAAMPVQVGRIK